MTKIAIVNSKSFGRYYPEHISRLEKIGAVDRIFVDKDIDGISLAKELKDYKYIITSVTPNYTREFFENAPNLELISRDGLGYNSIDTKAATDYGVIVTKLVGDHERNTVAELAVTFLTNQNRMVLQADRALKENEWDRKAEFVGKEFFNMTVGVIGFGSIGSRVGEIMHSGFGSRVLAYDPNKSKEEIETSGAIKVELNELLTRSDAISLNAMVTDESKYIINKNTISQMKDGVLIANTARGALVVEDDIIDGLKSGKIGSYATDVYEIEPINSNHPFVQFDNVILTPHIGGYTDTSLWGMGDKCVVDVEKLSKGEKLEGVVNPEVLNN